MPVIAPYDPNDPNRLIQPLGTPAPTGGAPKPYQSDAGMGGTGPYATSAPPPVTVPPIAPTGPNGRPTAGASVAAPGTSIIAPAAVDLYKYQNDFGATRQNENQDAFGTRWNPQTQSFEQTVPDQIRRAAVTGYFGDRPTLAREAYGANLIGQMGRAPGNYYSTVAGLSPDDIQASRDFYSAYPTDAHGNDIRRYGSGGDLAAYARPGTIEWEYARFDRAQKQAASVRGLDSLPGTQTYPSATAAPAAMPAPVEPAAPMSPTNDWVRQAFNAGTPIGYGTDNEGRTLVNPAMAPADNPTVHQPWMTSPEPSAPGGGGFGDQLRRAVAMRSGYRL